MKSLSKFKFSIVLFLAMTILLPTPIFAQGDGGRKKKKKARTEQTTPARQSANKPVKSTSSSSKKSGISEPTGFYSGHGYVDLGLPSGLKWATCNVGASSPSDYGYYFAWGEVTPKSEYTESNCKTYNKSIVDISGNPEYDAARYNWGGIWRMPTKQECEELRDKCKWEWTSDGSNTGYKVTGPNGNSIFLPAAGYRYGTSLNSEGSCGYVWSSSPYESFAQDAYDLDFYDGIRYVDWSYRDYGHSVRPVAE